MLFYTCKSVAVFGARLVSVAGEHPAQDTSDSVQTLHGIAERWGQVTDGSVRPAVAGYDVRVNVHVIEAVTVQGSVQLAVHTLWVTWWEIPTQENKK